jgi:hypothetical protein
VQLIHQKFVRKDRERGTETAREGLDLAKSTICARHEQLALPAEQLVDARSSGVTPGSSLAMTNRRGEHHLRLPAGQLPPPRYRAARLHARPALLVAQLAPLPGPRA